MDRGSIEGVRVKTLEWHRDDRGRLLEIFRCDDEMFQGFGQVYVTTCKPGVVKAWHYHEKQTDSFAVVVGTLRVGLYDGREDSPTTGQVVEYTLSADAPLVLQIPKKVTHGFECVGDVEAMVLNVPTHPYDPDQPDEIRIDPFENDIPFKWNATRGG